MTEKVEGIVEVNPNQVIDVASFGGESEGAPTNIDDDEPNEAVVVDAAEEKKEEPIIPEKISQESIDKLGSLSENSEHLHISLGSIEVQKAQMVSQIMSLRGQIEQGARSALIEAGVPEDDVDQYRVDLKSGKIITVQEIMKMQQQIRDMQNTPSE